MRPGTSRLSTARARGGAVGLSSGGDGLAIGGRGGLADEDVMRVRKGGLAHTTDRLATARSLGVLPIGGEVERDEEDEVRAEDANAGDGGELLSSAPASIGEVREIRRRKICVRGEVDEA